MNLRLRMLRTGDAMGDLITFVEAVACHVYWLIVALIGSAWTLARGEPL